MLSLSAPREVVVFKSRPTVVKVCFLGISGIPWYNMGSYGIKQHKNAKNPYFLRRSAVDNFGGNLKLV